MNFKKRPISWSSISSWNYSKEQWARKYIDGIIEPANPAMTFGKAVGEELAKNPKFLPFVPRYSIFEHKLEAEIGNIKLIGFLDTYEPNKAFREYKTHGTTPWTQKRVNSHEQIDMYCLLLYLTEKIKPSDISIHLDAIPVQTKNDFSMEINQNLPILSFETKRTTKDILIFANKIKSTVVAMKAFAKTREKRSIL